MINRLWKLFWKMFSIWAIDTLLLIILFFSFGSFFSIFQNYYLLQEFKSITNDVNILNSNRVSSGNVFVCWETSSLSWELNDKEFWITFDWIVLKRYVETYCESWSINNKWWNTHLDLHYKDWCKSSKNDKYQTDIFYDSFKIGDYILDSEILKKYSENKDNFSLLSGHQYFWDNESAPKLWDQAVDFYWIHHWKYCVLWMLSWDRIMPIRWWLWNSFSFMTWAVKSFDSLKNSIVDEKSKLISNSWDIFRILFPLCINFICFTIIFFVTFSFSKLARSLIYTLICPILLVLSYILSSISPHNFFAYLLYPCLPLLVLVFLTHKFWIKRKDIENWAKSTEVYLVDSLMKNNHKS